jgi:outer membrane receptor protein involved in Fe transport
LGAASSALLASYAPVTAAQDAEVGEVIVTGSRIPRPDLESASPVTVLSQETIETSGVTDIGDLLQSIPSMSGSPIGTTTNNGGNGSVLIDLRGMGVDRTVTLVNGMRTVDGGDYQTIPQNMIERVEVLKDGGASVYGNDAVAGVVNIITRTNFDGLEFSLQTADYFDMDSGAQNAAGVVGGKTFDGGHLTFGLEYVDQEEAYQRDAPWDFFQNSYYIYPEGCERQVAAPYDGTPDGGCFPIGSSRIPEGRFNFGGVGLFMAPGGELAPWDGRTYNYAPVNYIQTPYERTNVHLDGAFALTDSVNFRGSIRGNFRESAQELAPTPLTTESDPAYQGFFNGVPYVGISEDNYYLVQAVTAYNATNPATPIPLGTPVINARRRMEEIPRRFEQDIVQYQANIGLDGKFSNGIRWNAFYNWGERSRTDQDFGQYSGPGLADALGPSADLDNDGTPECYGDINDPSSLIVGCVPLNLFAGPQAIPLEQLASLSANLTDSYKDSQKQAELSFSGELFDLPAGKMGWALGYSYGKREFTYKPDSAKVLGLVTGNVGAGTDGSLQNDAFFGEVAFPIFDNGSQSLDLRGGVRYDSYDQFDSEVTYSAGIEFYAHQDVKLRATYGTVFRAPTISDLFSGALDSFPTYSDPCDNDKDNDGTPDNALPAGCDQVAVQFDSQLRSRVGGNPNLEPETGDTFTAGVVWTPEFGGGGLSLTVDYWTIAIEDGISSLGVQFILDDCYVNQSAEACALVFRRADYSIDFVNDFPLNVADQGAEGIDTEIRYSWDTRIGRFSAEALWSHNLERTKTPFPGADEIDLVGRYTDPTAQDGGAYADDKINYAFKWFWNDWLVGYDGEFVSSLDADTFCNCGAGNRPDGSYIQKIDSVLYHDLIVQYQFGGAKVTAGVTNLTDEEPPFIDVGFNANTDPPTYRLFGRGYFLRASYSFE